MSDSDSDFGDCDFISAAASNVQLQWSDTRLSLPGKCFLFVIVYLFLTTFDTIIVLGDISSLNIPNPTKLNINLVLEQN